MEPMNPVRLCQVLEENIDENSILVADGGDFVGTASYIVRPRGPLTWLDPGTNGEGERRRRGRGTKREKRIFKQNIVGPFGTLGVGGGFALGAKLAKPDAEVWIIFGDGIYSLLPSPCFLLFSISICCT